MARRAVFTHPIIGDNSRLGPRSELLYPLGEFYEQAGLPLPAITSVEAGQIPAPYRQLLTHDRDMTPTLEEAHGVRLELRVLRHTLRQNLLSREIVLVGDGLAVEFGAIKIYLEHFSQKARGLILEMKQPLGTIFRMESITHTSCPSAYFRVESDETIGAALQLSGPATLYGRQNVLTDAEGHTLARVLEILAPVTPRNFRGSSS